MTSEQEDTLDVLYRKTQSLFALLCRLYNHCYAIVSDNRIIMIVERPHFGGVFSFYQEILICKTKHIKELDSKELLEQNKYSGQFSNVIIKKRIF